MSSKSKQPPALPEASPDLAATHSALASSLRIYNAVLAKQLGALFPADLSAQSVHDHLVAYRAAVEGTHSAGRAQKLAVAQAKSVDREARSVLRRLTLIVDGAYPAGNPHRAEFFPAGQAKPSSGEELAAMAKGIASCGLPLLPPDISLEDVRALERAAKAHHAARAAAGDEKDAVAAERVNLAARTRDIHKRLSAIVRGYFGPSSATLADFGLKAKVLPPHRRRAARTPPVGAPTSQNGSSGAQSKA